MCRITCYPSGMQDSCCKFDIFTVLISEQDKQCRALTNDQCEGPNDRYEHVGPSDQCVGRGGQCGRDPNVHGDPNGGPSDDPNDGHNEHGHEHVDNAQLRS